MQMVAPLINQRKNSNRFMFFPQVLKDNIDYISHLQYLMNHILIPLLFIPLILLLQLKLFIPSILLLELNLFIPSILILQLNLFIPSILLLQLKPILPLNRILLLSLHLLVLTQRRKVRNDVTLPTYKRQKGYLYLLLL